MVAALVAASSRDASTEPIVARNRAEQVGRFGTEVADDERLWPRPIHSETVRNPTQEAGGNAPHLPSAGTA